MSFKMWVLLSGDFGVGNRSTPLAVHQAWISRRRVGFGVKSDSLGRVCFVTGHVLLTENNHFSILSRSYVMPVMAVTGSFMI